MDTLDTVEMLAFNLKLLSKKSRKRVLISAGKISDKRKMLPAIQKLPGMNINIFATPGTSAFLPIMACRTRRCTRSAIG